MPEPTLYLFDGFNLLHAGGFEDSRELTDKLASFVAEKGARGVLVFDGTGEDLSYGPLEVRFAEHADTLLERLAAEHRGSEQVCLVSSDSPIRRHVRPGGDEALLRDLRPRLQPRRATASRSRCESRTSSIRKRGSG